MATRRLRRGWPGLEVLGECVESGRRLLREVNGRRGGRMASRPMRLRDLTPERSTKRAARIALRLRLGGVARRIPGAADARRAEMDTEHVHRLRTATRRAVAALDVFAPCLPANQVKEAKKLLKRLRRSAERARDLDVQAEFWHRLADEEPGVIQAVGVMLALNRADRPLAQNEIVVTAKACPPRRVKNIRDRLVDSAKHARINGRRIDRLGPFADESLGIVAGLLRAMIDEHPRTPDKLHRARIMAKRLRYSVELFRWCLDRDVACDLLSDLESLHDRMGVHNDLIVARDLVAALGRGGAVSEGVAGPLGGVIEARLVGAGGDAIEGLERFAEDWLGAGQGRFFC